jgi:aryl-alcohol dehydrogenase-like predicted oxidoreductase
MARKIRLGHIGAEVPAIGFGTWGHGGPWQEGETPVGWSGQDDAQHIEALLVAHAAGLIHWDTADVYGRGHSERLIGALWERVPRESVFLATKVGWVEGRYGHAYHPRQIRAQLEASLRQLATDWIDLYYFHRCEFGPGDVYLDGALAELHRAREEGKIRFIGLSDWQTPRVARHAVRIQPDVVQVYRNVLEDDYAASGLKAWVENNDAGVAFFSPLMHGLLLGRYDAPPALGEGDHRLRVPAFRDLGLLAHLRRCRCEVEARFPEHPEPVLHALTGALLADSPTACVLLGLRRAGHAEAAARVGDALSPADAEWVRRLYNELPEGAGPVLNPWRG